MLLKNRNEILSQKLTKLQNETSGFFVHLLVYLLMNFHPFNFRVVLNMTNVRN